MNKLLPGHDVLWLVLDSLRHDVAVAEWEGGRTPNLARLTGPGGWEKRHTPGSFTFPAHQAFFAGFLPTPADPEASRERLFAARFAGSETTGGGTKVFEEANVIAGLRAEGYHTMCIGGVGFFNQQTALSRVLTDLFDESHWCTEFGVTCRESPVNQFRFAAGRVGEVAADKPLCCFINVSALHQPNYFYCRESGPDDLESHAAALRAVDEALPVLMEAFQRRCRPVFHITCSDHGTAYGEEGFTGHRMAVPAVWDVPYAHGVVDLREWEEKA
ncbi:STM4013/SEN3800 family hydrolase [Prosthecobacter sp.]|uniref:STM4013/SEN3800 family hydrolase n=1 Tax=Prosthecobacter sp. TaxID=1965333 RepID=UPI003784A2D1